MLQNESTTRTTLAGLKNDSYPQDLLRGSTLGRYVIIEYIGSGGMGTVYRAYDPQLNRGIALKILSLKHASLRKEERAKARLIREAQALARLSHPNVVAVHDVGTFRGDVFIAMELVEGKTLSEWLKRDTRSIKEILKVMIAAGKGLSAAHKAGLVHRDFKPSNVIVGNDDRVRVLDFGLARATHQQEADEDNLGLFGHDWHSQEPKSGFNLKQISCDFSPNLLQSPLTRVGGVLGTPLYMAPEQHLGLKTDERTDQFGFCVVLYEALYGKRPFVASSRDELERKVVQQQVTIPGTDTGVPVWLWRIIRKGLSLRLEDRYQTIELLLEDLSTDPEAVRRQKQMVRRRKLFAAISILLIVALPIGVWYGLRYRTVQLCKDVKAETVGVWDGATKSKIKEAFLNTKKSFAQGTWERVKQNFDSFLSSWTQMRSDVCEARLIHGSQSEELFDLRMGCLQKRLAELESLVKVFARADAGVVQKAVKASASLSAVASCADENALHAAYPPPKTAKDKHTAAIIRKKLIRAQALRKAGKFREGLVLTKNLERMANTLDYAPVQAEVLYCLADLFHGAGEIKSAQMKMYEAARLAGISKNSRLVAQAMTYLVYLVGYDQGRSDEALLISRNTEIFIELSGGDDLLRANFFSNVGSVFFFQTKYKKALQYYRKALALSEPVLGPAHYDIAMFVNNIGSVLSLLGDQDQALIYFQRSLEITENALGTQHPEVAQKLNNIGTVCWNKHQYDSALAIYQRALVINQGALGLDHPETAHLLNNVGLVQWMKKDYEKATLNLQRALTIWESTLGEENPLVAWPASTLGEVFLAKGMFTEAYRQFSRVAQLCEHANCQAEPYGRGLFGLARTLVDTGKDAGQAISLAKKAKDLLTQDPKDFKEEQKEIDAWVKTHQK